MLISPLIDAHLVVGVGDHSATNNMHGVDIQPSLISYDVVYTDNDPK